MRCEGYFRLLNATWCYTWNNHRGYVFIFTFFCFLSSTNNKSIYNMVRFEPVLSIMYPLSLIKGHSTWGGLHWKWCERLETTLAQPSNPKHEYHLLDTIMSISRYMKVGSYFFPGATINTSSKQIWYACDTCLFHGQLSLHYVNY